ncbi:MAG: hypothetical protein K8H88_20630 [Sandaracinaceae bacterium]|nr:hypothetical protein [Sandaracinaceae bacterium]
MAIALLAGACSGPARDPDEAFAEIQVHEARLARATAGGCEDCAEEARASAASICAIAEAIQDPDARVRCERARRAAP